LDQRKQAKLQWLSALSKTTGDSLNDVRHEVDKHFRNKTREYMKHGINGFPTQSMNKNVTHYCTGTHLFKRGYQLRSNLVKAGNGDLLEDSQKVLTEQMEIHIAKQSVLNLDLLG
jgi:hypothetical protein